MRCWTKESDVSKTKSAPLATEATTDQAEGAVQHVAEAAGEATDEADGVYGDPTLPPILGGSYVVEGGKRRLVDRTQHE